MAICYIGLGSNLGDREEQVLRAVHEMRSFSRVKKISTLSDTKPFGVADQPKFLNAVVEIDTEYDPDEVMTELLRIESEMGRVRTVKGAPREIDLDLLAHGATVLSGASVDVPHPRMHERRFVMAPLAELAPDWVHPVLKRTAREILSDLPEDPD